MIPLEARDTTRVCSATCECSDCTGTATSAWPTEVTFYYDVSVTRPEPAIEPEYHEYYTEIPKRIDPVKIFKHMTDFKIKQPIARSGFKRGQRR